jgi:hypothetical protein
MKGQAVDPFLREAVLVLCRDQELRHFALGGGTSLALRHPYRISDDADFFSASPFDSLALMGRLSQLLPECHLLNRTRGSVCVSAGGIKLEFFHHPYPLLQPFECANEFRLLATADLAAMKINAVINRGSKKDFSDLLFLHGVLWRLDQALDAYCQKYGESGRFLALRSLSYFQDAEEEPDPSYLNGWNWPFVQKKMQDLVRAIATPRHEL